jgi:dolichol-phosphate mannosyltransferase
MQQRTTLKELPTPLESRSITVVIPCLNEEGNLERLFELMDQAFDKLGFTLPVLLVNDGSTDNTPKILEQLCQQYPFLSVIHHPHAKGVASVWKTAIEAVKTDWIFWGQADLESDPSIDIPMLIEACGSGVDALAGWRQGRGDGKKGASTFANSACRLAFGLQIHDMNWIKLVRRDLLVDIPVELTTHRYLLAVLAGRGHNVSEIPTPWFPRFSGTSKFGKGRLLTSAADFSQVCWWFYVQEPTAKINQYMDVVASAIRVGLRAGKESFLSQIQADLQRNALSGTR